jgi:putrescine transport system substrate-binding protein
LTEPGQLHDRFFATVSSDQDLNPQDTTTAADAGRRIWEKRPMYSLTRRRALKAGAAALALPLFARTAWAEGKVNVYNWTDYIGETTLDDFTKATGIKVTYDTYDTTEAEEAKLLAGRSGYDVVLHAGSSIPRFIEAGIFQKLDRSKLTNWQNLDPAIVKIIEGYDPGNQYGVPYMWGTVGMTYNLDMVKERLGENAPVNSLDLIFKPEFAEKLAGCGISILDSPGDVFPMVLKYLGKDPDTTNPEDYEAVVEAFKPIRQFIKTFDASNYLNALPNKALCAAMTWSGDYATAKARAAEAGVDVNLAYFVPETGSPAWFDLWAIPADAPNVDNAHAFINYMMDPKAIAGATNFTNYAHANIPAKEFTNKEVLDDPAVFPNAEIQSKLWTPKVLDKKLERARTRAWSKIKTG